MSRDHTASTPAVPRARAAGRARAVLAGAVLTVSLAALVGSPATADATTTSTTGAGSGTAGGVAVLRARGTAEINRRLVTLADLTRDVAGDGHLTAAHRAALIQHLSAEAAGLTALKSRIAGETDLAALRNDVRAIVAAYRVYVLVVPEVRMVTAADSVVQMTGRFSALDQRLRSALAQARAKGADTSAAEGLLRDAEARVTGAQGLAGPLPAQLIALTPPGWPANRAVLVSARGSLRSARIDLAGARQDLRRVVESLRDLRTPRTTTTT